MGSCAAEYRVIFDEEYPAVLMQMQVVHVVGRCSFTLSKTELKAAMISVLETKM